MINTHMKPQNIKFLFGNGSLPRRDLDAKLLEEKCALFKVVYARTENHRNCNQLGGARPGLPEVPSAFNTRRQRNNRQSCIQTIKQLLASKPFHVKPQNMFPRVPETPFIFSCIHIFNDNIRRLIWKVVDSHATL